ncbi:MAG: monovalent cation/H(+) antiporter subunit G [Candidatus Promineifilaceae bacterium]|nr:monovalent cation/H(+) antiporter subunit G [Candidatus Promineifilaceae bacterium]
MTVLEWLIVAFVFFGTFFLLIAAIGLNRMPDLYTRMHGAAKSTTLGITGIMAATALFFFSSAAVTRALLVVLFFFLTAPVATHVLARAAYFRNVRRWHGTVLDELEGQYDPASHTLASQAAQPAGETEQIAERARD